MDMLEDMPDNFIESVVGTPSDVEVARSKKVVQLKGYQRKHKANLENIVVHIVNDRVDLDLHTYLQ